MVAAGSCDDASSCVAPAMNSKFRSVLRLSVTSRVTLTDTAKATELLRGQLAESGANYLVCRFAFGDLSLSESTRSLELFQRHVMPALRESVPVAAE